MPALPNGSWLTNLFQTVMCWHAYLLSPVNYYLDCETMHPSLRKVGGFPLEAVAFRIHPQTREYNPDPTQVEEWELETLLPFEPPLSTTSHCTAEIFCPQCDVTNVVPWLTPTQVIESDSSDTSSIRGEGLAQSGFAKKCIACDLVITREAFCANRAARDITRASQAIAKGQDAFLSYVQQSICLNSEVT